MVTVSFLADSKDGCGSSVVSTLHVLEVHPTRRCCVVVLIALSLSSRESNYDSIGQDFYIIIVNEFASVSIHYLH
jgi:hypothetical protein